MSMLKAAHVRFQYEYENEAPQIVLRDIDLTIEAGSFVALLGHNGSGKSTLAKHFNAILLPSGGYGRLPHPVAAQIIWRAKATGGDCRYFGDATLLHRVG